MAGLRAKQKAQRRSLIEKAASELFVEKGFADTAIEEIAERAMVSAPTVYNYYGTKGDLLLALVARGEEGILDAESDFDKQTKDYHPIDLVTKVIHSNVSDTISSLSRELWGHVVAFVATATDPDVAPRYLNTIADGLAAAIKRVLIQYEKDGVFREGVDPEELAYLLTRMERIHFLNFVYLKNMPKSELEENIAKDVKAIVGALLVEK